MRYGTAVGIWIGMKRPRHRRTRCPDPVKWTDGSDVSFTNYLDEQPNCRWPDEDCFHIIDNERWNDAECEVRCFHCVLKCVPDSSEQSCYALLGPYALRLQGPINRQFAY